VPRRSSRVAQLFSLGGRVRMSSNLYLVFDRTNGGASLPQFVQGLAVSGYSFSAEPLKSFIEPPGEPQAPVRCGFYAQNYFRVFISDSAVQLYREAALPSDLAVGEKQLLAAIFGRPDFRLRRWISTSEDWDDDDKSTVQIVSEGTDKATLRI
jgi:hypothetical protein